MCETSGMVRRRLRQRGIDAYSFDILPAEDGERRYHIVGDALEAVKLGWHGMIGHPPCTRLCNSGVRWLAERNLWQDMEQAALFFRALWTANIPYIALENPIPHKYAVEIIGQQYHQLIQPYDFGHPERKATCFWLKGLPKLIPTNNVKAAMLALPKKESSRVHFASPGEDRWRERSRTLPGIAEAMTNQWGKFLEEQTYENRPDIRAMDTPQTCNSTTTGFSEGTSTPATDCPDDGSLCDRGRRRIQ